MKTEPAHASDSGPVVPGKANILIVIGTRPEAIKMLPVIIEMRNSEYLNPVVVSSGQHGALVEEILDLGGITVDADLGCAGLSLCSMWSAVMSGLERLCAERFNVDGQVQRSREAIWGSGFPAAMLVHGDTSTAAAAAVAGFQMRIPVVHVEAGLRTNELDSPFPEESNRQIIDRVATLYLAPITENEQNLIRENIEHEQVFVTGNTGIDAIQYVTREAACGTHHNTHPDPQITEALRGERKLVLVTAHRRESWGGGIAHIGQAVAALAVAHPEVVFVVATHPNPAVRAEMVAEVQGRDNVLVAEAQTYPEFARLLARAEFVISDSGGIQEEAPSVNTPVLVTRDVTERAEGVEAGTLQLVGTDPAVITAAAEELLTNPAALSKMREAENPYGDGHASQRIVAALEWLGGFGPEPERFHCGFSRKVVLEAAGYPTDRDTISDTERFTLAADWLAEREG